MQISGCSAVLVARLNGVQEAVSSTLATRTKKSNDFTSEIVGFFLFSVVVFLGLTTFLTTMPTILLCLIGFVLCAERLAEALYRVLADGILHMEIMLRHIGVGVSYDALDGLDIHAQSLHL